MSTINISKDQQKSFYTQPSLLNRSNQDNELKIKSFFGKYQHGDSDFKIIIQKHRQCDLQKVPILEDIERKTADLKSREIKQKDLISRYKRLYEETLEQKNAEIQELNKENSILSQDFISTCEKYKETKKKYEELSLSMASTHQSQEKNKDVSGNQQGIQLQKISQQNQQIVRCNSILQKILQNHGENEAFKTAMSANQLLTGPSSESDVSKRFDALLTEFEQRSEQFSSAILRSHQLQELLIEAQIEVRRLSDGVQNLKASNDEKEEEVQQLKNQIEVINDSERFRDAVREKDNKSKALKLSQFEENLLKTLNDFKLEQYSSIYSEISFAIKGAFKAFNNYVSKDDSLSELQTAITEYTSDFKGNCQKLSDLLRVKAEHETVNVNNMLGHLQKFKEVLNEAQDQSPIKQQSFGLKSPEIPRKQNFQSEELNIVSPRSEQRPKKSIVLEDDLEDIMNRDHQADPTSNESSRLYSSRETLGAEEKSDKRSPRNEDEINQSEETKSKISQMSQSEQNQHYNQNVKNAKLKRKLTKHTRR